MRLTSANALSVLIAMSAIGEPPLIEPRGPHRRPKQRAPVPKSAERERTALDELRLARAAEKRKRQAARQAKGMATKGEGQP